MKTLILPLSGDFDELLRALSEAIFMTKSMIYEYLKMLSTPCASTNILFEFRLKLLLYEIAAAISSCIFSMSGSVGSSYSICLLLNFKLSHRLSKLSARTTK